MKWSAWCRGRIKAERIGPRAIRYYASEQARAQALPSFALEQEVEKREAGELDGPSIRPIFRRHRGRQRVTLEVQTGTSLYGTGEAAGTLLRNGRRTVCWNSDKPCFGEEEESLYQSHPWVLAVHEDGTAFGVLADTTYRCTIDLSAGILFEAEGPPYPVIIIEGEDPKQVLGGLADLTGRMQLPPKWALGYQQCRWSYYPDSRVREIADAFRARRIPCDVLWMDIHYMRGYRIFTFDPEHFPNPENLNDYLHERGFKTAWMIDPGVKKDEGYDIYEQGTAEDHWVKDPEGHAYVGDVWPGPCVFPDFTREETAIWWASLYKPFLATGIDGVWNDMNEPSVFNSLTKLMDEKAVHRGFGGDTHDRFHNVYGLLMVKASRKGILNAKPNHRPFLLTRANYIGGHRYAATWTGDNVSSWAHLRMSTPMVLNMGLSGQPFVGPDIGGFGGNADGVLFRRWLGIGALFPFARGHTAERTQDHEPWVFGEKTEATCRVAIERRYRLMPYLYTLFREAATTGLPVMRPVFFADLQDPALRGEDESFLLGDDLLVVTDAHPDKPREPVRPRGRWVPLRLDDVADPELPRLLLRGGAILPAGPVMQYVDQQPLDPLLLYVCLDSDGRAAGLLYEDEGDGFAYQDGAFRVSRYRAERRDSVVELSTEVEHDGYTPPLRHVVVNVLKTDGTMITGDGTEAGPILVRLPG